jgi:WD40 repeat protein
LRVRFRLDHCGPVTWAAFNPSGATIVTGSADFTARIWNAASGTELVRLNHEAGVERGAFSSDGTKLVTVSQSTACVWDTCGNLLSRLKHEDRVVFCHFNADGTRLATASGHTAQIWDWRSGRKLGSLSHSKGSVHTIRFNRDDGRVVTACSDGTARIWDVNDGVELHWLQHKDAVNDAVFSNDGTLAMTSSDDNTARLWNATMGAEICRFVHRSCVSCALFSPGDQLLLTRSFFDAERVRARFDPESGGRILGWWAETYRVRKEDDIASPDERSVAIWNTTGNEVRRLVHEESVTTAAYGPDGRRILTASDCTARLWDAKTGVELVCLPHEQAVKIAIWNPAGDAILTVTNNGVAQLCDAA